MRITLGIIFLDLLGPSPWARDQTCSKQDLPKHFFLDLALGKENYKTSFPELLLALRNFRFVTFVAKLPFHTFVPKLLLQTRRLKQWVGFVYFVRDNLRLATFVSEFVTCENFLFVVLDSVFLFQSFHFVAVVPEAVQLLDKIFGTFVAELVVRNFWITTSVSELMAD